MPEIIVLFVIYASIKPWRVMQPMCLCGTQLNHVACAVPTVSCSQWWTLFGKGLTAWLLHAWRVINCYPLVVLQTIQTGALYILRPRHIVEVINCNAALHQGPAQGQRLVRMKKTQDPAEEWRRESAEQKGRLKTTRNISSHWYQLIRRDNTPPAGRIFEERNTFGQRHVPWSLLAEASESLPTYFSRSCKEKSRLVCRLVPSETVGRKGIRK